MDNHPNGNAVVGYVRVSTAEQVESGASLVSQEAAIRSYCALNGLRLVEVVRDEGVSAKDLNREGLRRALGLLSDGTASGLVAAKLDRLSRSVVDFANLMAWCDLADCSLVALDMGIDTSTAAGRLVANVMAAVAEWERDVISQRTRDAAAVRRAEGKATGRTSVRVALPEVAVRISGARASGASWQAIADSLNADNVPTVRGGLKWRVSSVQSAAGYVRPRGKRRASELPEVRRRNVRLAATPPARAGAS